MPLAPLLLQGGALFAVLLAAQFVLGCSHAPIFPVSAGVFEAWFKPDKWPLVQGLQSIGAAARGLAHRRPSSPGSWRPSTGGARWLWTTLPGAARDCLLGLVRPEQSGRAPGRDCRRAG